MPVPQMPFPRLKNGDFPAVSAKSYPGTSGSPEMLYILELMAILEPLPDAPKIDRSEVDLMLVPSVGCDVRGYWLGYGGGYYDRMLSLAEWESKVTIGIIFEFALLAQLPVDSWDKPLHGICTEIDLTIVQQKSRRSIDKLIFPN